MIKNALDDDLYRKKVIIDSYASMLAYECYLNYVMYKIDDKKVEDIFYELNNYCEYYDERIIYKNEIYEKTKGIIKKEYNDLIFSNSQNNRQI